MKWKEMGRNLIDVRGEERGVSLLMFLYFFLVITSFWILKPIKKTLFIDYYAEDGFAFLGWIFDAVQAEQLAKVANMIVAMGAVVVFSALSRNLQRERLTYVFTSFFLVSYGFYALVPPGSSGWGVWSFYLLGDLFSTLMVATFFAFLNDSVSPDRAKRLYGLVGLGGVFGGVFGSSAVALWIGAFDHATWMAIAGALGVVILIVARAAAAGFERLPPDGPPASEARSDVADVGRNPALSGARLVARSPYLFSIVGIVGLYELVSTMLDFQFSSAVLYLVEDPGARSQHYASVFAATNWVSMLVQLILTSFVMRTFGLSVALMLLPVAIVGASAGFVAVPVLWSASLLSVVDNGLAYSINQSSKEALYVPTTTEEKYQAKAFIDMFVQRFAKALAVGIALVLTMTFEGMDGLRMVSIPVLLLVLIWSGAAVYAGRRFRRLAATSENAGV